MKLSKLYDQKFSRLNIYFSFLIYLIRKLYIFPPFFLFLSIRTYGLGTQKSMKTPFGTFVRIYVQMYGLNIYKKHGILIL